MGRKRSWFSSVKKAFSPESKEKKEQKANKSKNRLAEVEKDAVLAADSAAESTAPTNFSGKSNEEVENAAKTVQSAKFSGKSNEEVENAAKTVDSAKFSGKSKEEVAAITIQTAFRGFQARRGFKALRGLLRLRSLVNNGQTVKRQTLNALKYIQTLSRVQSEIRSRRNMMLEENQALQKQILQKHAKEIENLKRGEEWDDSLQSKEKIEANLLSKYEAARRRERALAYSYSHQQTWKKSSRSLNLMFMDPTNPQWGWSWLERWTGARPLEAHGSSETELKTDQVSAKSINLSRRNITKKKLKPPSPRVRETSQEEDARSVFSVQTKLDRRHTIGGSLVRDDESLGSSPSLPSYMASTRSAKAKTRVQSPLAMENWTPEKGSVDSVKKRLSYPPSQTLSRRHSGPPKVGTSMAEPERNGEIN